MTLEATYEPQWRLLDHASRFLQPVDTRRMVALRRPAIADLFLDRFHLCRPQDVMHDFEEGILKWYIMTLFQQLNLSDAEKAAVRTALEDLRTAQKLTASTLDLPNALSDEELRGEKLQWTGTKPMLPL